VIGFYFLKKPAPGVEDISSVPIFFEKKIDDASSVFPRFQPL